MKEKKWRLVLNIQDVILKKVPQHIFKFGPFNIVSFGTFGPTKVLETALLSVFH